MKRTERDWFQEPERPRGGAHTVVPMPTRSDEPPDYQRAALFLSGLAVGSFVGVLIDRVLMLLGAA